MLRLPPEEVLRDPLEVVVVRDPPEEVLRTVPELELERLPPETLPELLVRLPPSVRTVEELLEEPFLGVGVLRPP